MLPSQIWGAVGVSNSLSNHLYSLPRLSAVRQPQQGQFWCVDLLPLGFSSVFGHQTLQRRCLGNGILC